MELNRELRLVAHTLAYWYHFSHVGINFHIFRKICKAGRCRKLEYLKIEFPKQIHLRTNFVKQDTYFVLWLFYDHWFPWRWIGMNIFIYYYICTMQCIHIKYILPPNLFKTQQIHAFSLNSGCGKLKSFCIASLKEQIWLSNQQILPCIVNVVPNKLKACSKTWQYLPISLTFHDWQERTQKRNLQLCQFGIHSST